jgi:hypothetical protein
MELYLVTQYDENAEPDLRFSISGIFSTKELANSACRDW